MRFHPLIQNSRRYISRFKWVCCTQTLTSTEHHISSLHSHLWVQLSAGSTFPQPNKNVIFLRFFNIIGECGSTLYVGLAHAVPPTSTKFKLLLLLTQVGMPYTNTHKHRLHSHVWVRLCSGSPFLPPDKNRKFLLFFIINIRECGCTLYVGLAFAVPPTNKKFKSSLLPTQTGIPYTNTHKHRTSYSKSTLTFLGPAKLWKCLSAAQQNPEILAVLHSNNFNIFFFNISSNKFPPRYALKCLQNLYQSIYLKKSPFPRLATGHLVSNA